MESTQCRTHQQQHPSRLFDKEKKRINDLIGTNVLFETDCYLQFAFLFNILFVYCSQKSSQYGVGCNHQLIAK